MSKFIQKLNEWMPTYGNQAFALLIMIAISGVFIAIPYDINKPYESLCRILLQNKPAAFFRSIHYWSSQLFLILSIIHTIEHILKNSDLRLKTGVWLRLSLVVPVILFVMLSGFLLRADADAQQAKAIFDTLLSYIPLIGNNISYSLLGGKNSYQLVYMHHIATATIIIFLVTIEHAKNILPKLKAYYFVLPVVLISSIIFVPTIHTGLDNVIKGPWYFLGLQEILHWTGNPIYIIIASVLVLCWFYYFTRLNLNTRKYSKYVFLILLIAYSVLSITGIFFRGANWKLVSPFEAKIGAGKAYLPALSLLNSIPDSIYHKNIPTILGKPEGCLACHSEMQGMSVSHETKAIGCFSCHLGNPFTLDKKSAHNDMVICSGNLDVAIVTCGANGCHEDISQRSNSNIMASMAGVVSVDKFVFGEAKIPDNHFDIRNIQYTPADKHLRNLCAGCHIGKNKNTPAPIDELSRGGGCSACHLDYSDTAKLAIEKYNSSKKRSDNLPKIHPNLTINILSKNCFGCHSRSGRISLCYEGWSETELTAENYYSMKDNSNYRLLLDGRVVKFVKEDVHFKSGMTCIDCHTSREVMGDGKKYFHKEEQVKIECEDCHQTNRPALIRYEKLDRESKKIADLRLLSAPGRQYIAQRKSAFAMINVYLNESGVPVMRLKNKDTVLQLKKPLAQCGTDLPGHKRLSCKSCHSSWAPQCINCHTKFDPKQKGWDNLLETETNGAWTESASNFLAEPPVLGITRYTESSNQQHEKVETFVPGMNLRISATNKSNIFTRQHAQAFSHTITRESRTCESCHWSSLALGYGRGELSFNPKNSNKLIFKPEYLIESDKLPSDAWIGYFNNPISGRTTRSNSRPFNHEEQKRILLVGSCLQCHKSWDKKLKKAFEDFGNFRKYITKKCTILEF